MTKIAPSFIKTVITPTKKSLNDFVKQLHTTYQNFSQAFNGGISYGDGVNTENINGSWASLVTPTPAGTNFTVTHGLNRIPVGVHVTQKNAFCDVLVVSSTKTQITLQASAAGAAIKLFIFLLFLSLLPLRSKAQGYEVQNVAWKAVTVAGSTGLSGNILQPVSGAVISVCPGSVAPASGTTCSPVTSTLYSNVGLTTTISNPTNADINGNYTFFVTAAQNYIISISGTGLTTYSYVVTAPVVTPAASGANAALSNLSAVSINTSLLAQTGVDLGSTINPFRSLFLFGGGSYGSTYFQDTGTPTGARVQTKQDISDTYVYRSSVDTLANKTLNVITNTLVTTTNVAGHYLRNNGTQYVDGTIQSGDLPTITGFVPVAASSNLTAQQANVSLTTLFTPSANGYYRISGYEVLTQAATTSSTLPSVGFTYTDGDTNVALGPLFFIAATNSNNTVGSQGPCNSVGGPCQIYFYARSGAAVQFETLSYASNGATPMQFALHIRVEGPF